MLEDDVNGTVIGTQFIKGALYYSGRQQGQPFYAETDQELAALGRAEYERIKADCGAVFRDIYPGNTWETRAHQ